MIESTFIEAKSNFDYCEGEYWVTIGEILKLVGKEANYEGDCEDFAAFCVAKLRSLGYPARYILCRTEKGGLHCIAEINGKALDVRYHSIVDVDMLPYEWLFISGASVDEPWQKIRIKKAV